MQLLLTGAALLGAGILGYRAWATSRHPKLDGETGTKSIFQAAAERRAQQAERDAGRGRVAQRKAPKFGRR